MSLDHAKGYAALTWRRIRKRAFLLRTAAEQFDRQADSGGGMAKVLGAMDLMMLGIGGIIGAGVFVLTGVAANQYAGPAVIVSYTIAAIAAMLSALSYTEFVVELPVAGGAYNYIALVFGELIAWIVACNLILEYTLSAAAVARGFSSYAATLAGFRPDQLVIPAGGLQIDIAALLLIILLCAMLAYGMQESSRFNMIVTSINLVIILYVLCAGFPFANPENLQPFAPFGVRGIFTAASVVFFSFIGFDTVATAAEEVKNPAVDLPIGIVGSLLVCTVLYGAMSLAIAMMVPTAEIDINAPFSAAFLNVVGQGASHSRTVFLQVSARLVSAGAVSGIVTSLLVSLLGQARIYVVLGREHLLPAWLAKVHPTKGTPVNATWLTAVTAGTLALLVNIDTLAELVSIGTLFVFFMVSAGVIFRRYFQPGTSSPLRPVAYRLAAITAFCIGFSVSYTFGAHYGWMIAFILLWAIATASLFFLPVAFRPARFTIPLTPFTPSLGMLATIHLIGSLGAAAYIRFLVWLVVSLVAYAFYSVHKAEARDRYLLSSENTEHDYSHIAAATADGAAGLPEGGEAEKSVQIGEIQETAALQPSPMKKVRDGAKSMLLGDSVSSSDPKYTKE